MRIISVSSRPFARVMPRLPQLCRPISVLQRMSSKPTILQVSGPNDPRIGNPMLYRVSTGHEGVFCEACHGSTHGIWPNKKRGWRMTTWRPGSYRVTRALSSSAVPVMKAISATPWVVRTVCIRSVQQALPTEVMPALLNVIRISARRVTAKTG